MISIISEEKDVTTNYVIDWLLYYKATFKRQNAETASVLNSFIINNNTTSLTINSIDQKNSTKVWHRRGKRNFFEVFLKGLSKDAVSQSTNLNRYLSGEGAIVAHCVEKYLKTDKRAYIGSYLAEKNNNKLDVLLAAKNNKLSIPNTLVTSSKVELLQFYNTHKTIITKDLYHPVDFNYNNSNYGSIGTFVVTKAMITNLEDVFFPIFVQKKVEKKYEIRIFYYKDKLFSMAIFSQKDKKTAVDYRNYNTENPNKCVPVILPKNIKNNLLKTLQDLNLSTGSIDFMVDQAGEYVFLEVNPMGQLDWVSKNCNYYIEKYIAEDLIKK